MDSAAGRQTSLWRGCPIRILRAHRSHAAPPERFAGLRVLLRPSAPRHPPRTLVRLCSPDCSVWLPFPHRLTAHSFAFLCFSRSLSSYLGNIEVILVLYICLSATLILCVGAGQLFKVRWCSYPRQLKSGNQPADLRHLARRRLQFAPAS